MTMEKIISHEIMYMYSTHTYVHECIQDTYWIVYCVVHPVAAAVCPSTDENHHPLHHCMFFILQEI